MVIIIAVIIWADSTYAFPQAAVAAACGMKICGLLPLCTVGTSELEMLGIRVDGRRTEPS
jgi:hypothetical protein